MLRYARPLYEVVAAAKVRKEFDLNSQFVTQLPERTRLHVVEIRRLADGNQRVQIIVAGQLTPIGWLTARKLDGTRTIVEVTVAGEGRPQQQQQGELQRQDLVQLKASSLRYSDARPRTQERRLNLQRVLSGPIRTKGSSASAPAAAGQNSSTKRNQAAALSDSTLDISDPGAREGRAGRPLKSAAPAADASAMKQSKNAGNVKDSTNSKTASASKEIPPPPKGREKSLSAMSQVALEQLAADVIKQRSAFLPAAEVEAVAKEDHRKAQELLAANDQQKPVPVQLGEALARRGIKLPQLMREWDPNGDGVITKMEFRQDVRKLLGNPNINEVDALYKEIDADGGGELDVMELKLALKQLQLSANSAVAESSGRSAEAEALLSKASQSKMVAHLTRHFEELVAKMEESQQGTVALQLGNLLVKKGVKIGDLVHKWDHNGNGTMSQKEFRHQVVGLGVQASVEQVDAFFCTLDTDDTGSLDLEEVKKALKRIQDDGDASKARLRSLCEETVDAFRKMRVGQSEWKTKQDEEAAAAEVEEEKAQAEEKQKAKEAAEAKAAKEAALLAKKEQELAQKKEFDAKIAAKRAKGKYTVPTVNV